MFSFFYNIGLRAYQLLARAVTPVNAKARLWSAGQHQVLSRLAHALPSRTGPAAPSLAWFHAASLGEFEQGRPVIDAFRAQYPDYLILLTFFSPSGYEVRKDYAGADFVFYLPLDTPRNARQFIEIVQPSIAFFIKYEFWANYLRELRANNVPTVLFSALFRPDQLFFKPYGGFYRKLLTCFSHILVQNPESVELLRGIGVTNVTVSGDTRFDRVAQTAAAAPEVLAVRAFKANMPLLVVGSAWPEDMAVLIPFLNAFDKPLNVIIAPHEIHDDELTRWQEQL
ncbi:MAG: 3-deoxy-D-manno-octulosonic acid transferase, partial [Spirosoma sp.]|nr:3-deoxy-D-manno-octulosonic acid transferase [Spirosoma sp.]